MKKKVLVSAIFVSAVLATSVFALQPKSEDYVVVPDETAQQENITNSAMSQTQTQSKKRVKSNKKTVKASDYQIIDDSQSVKKQDNTPAIEAVGELGQYIKIKKDGKFGVVDKKGNVILAPVFQAVDLVEQDGNQYLKAKSDGKYRLYQITGNLVPEKDINSFTQNTSLLLARDLNPIFKTAIANKFVLYTKVEKQQSSDSLVYEIKEIPIVKVSNGQVVNTNKNVQNTVNSDNEKIATSVDDANYFTVGKKQYKLVTEYGKMGVYDSEGLEILPVRFDTIELKKPCKHFKNPVFLVSSNNFYSLYDEKGIILAEQIFDKINVYRNGKLYTYSLENGKGILKADGKELGTFVLTEKGDYKYKPKNKFTLIKPHMVNSLIITILNI